MLFVALFKRKSGTSKEGIARRIQYQIPEGIKPVAEYWLQTSDPAVISIAEADNVASLMSVIADWDDLFDISVFPAITAKAGLELAKQMM